jgi:hypothetical protein
MTAPRPRPQRPQARALPCGTNSKYSSYAHRCRCADCREAHRLEAAKYRAYGPRRSRAA